MRGTGVLWWLKNDNDGIGKRHVLEQWGWVARLIEEETRLHGKKIAEDHVRRCGFEGVAGDAVDAAVGR